MVHDEQCGSPVLRESRMQREVVLFPTQRRFFLFFEAVGPKGCTTRKLIFTKERARTTHGRKLTERSAEPGERTDPRYELLSVRRRGAKRHGGKREKERKKMRGREDEEGKGGGMSRAGRDGVVDWQENEITEEGGMVGISYSFILQRPRELRAPSPFVLSSTFEMRPMLPD